jgi:hypothetical protein
MWKKVQSLQLEVYFFLGVITRIRGSIEREFYKGAPYIQQNRVQNFVVLALVLLKEKKFTPLPPLNTVLTNKKL